MAEESVWTGTLNFVLVSIPVELAPAVHEQRIAFRLMHEADHVPLQRRLYCPTDDTTVHGEHVVSGYPVDQDRYVVVTREEYDALEPERSRTIRIDTFVNWTDIDPVYFDRPYYLVPREGGERAYRLLTEVLERTGRAGIAKFVLHDREHLVALWPQDRVLGLMLLHFHQQVRNPDEVRPGYARPQKARVAAIAAVMQKLNGDYDPSAHVDEHRQRVVEFLREKAKAKGTVLVAAPSDAGEQPAEQEPGQDLVAALEESLARTRAK